MLELDGFGGVYYNSEHQELIDQRCPNTTVVKILSLPWCELKALAATLYRGHKFIIKDNQVIDVTAYQDCFSSDSSSDSDRS